MSEFLGDPCFSAKIHLKYGILGLKYMRVGYKY